MKSVFKNILLILFLITGCFALKAQSPCTPTIVTTANYICPGYQATLTAFGASSYTWFSSNGTVVNQSLVIDQIGDYTVVAQSGTCVANSSISIGIAPPPYIQIAASSQTICLGGIVTLTASGASSYTWTDGTTSHIGNTLVASPSVSTTYSVTGETSVCSESRDIPITVNPAPNIQPATSAQTVCAGKSVTLTASGASNYTWTTGTISYIGNPVVVSPTVSTIYYVIGGTMACYSTSAITISALNVPQLVIQTISSPTVCLGGSITITATGADTYDWTNGFTSYTGNPLVVAPLGSTTYSVTGNTSVCYGMAAAAVTVLNCPTAIRQNAPINDLISISPNPGNGLFIISAEKLLNPVLLEVYDITGKLIHKMEFEKQNALLHLENAPKGIYTIRLISNGLPACYKRIVIN